MCEKCTATDFIAPADPENAPDGVSPEDFIRDVDALNKLLIGRGISIFLSGLASGAGSTAVAMGLPPSQAADYARKNVAHSLEDPAVRLVIEEAVKGFLSGNPPEGETVMKVAHS